MSKARKRKRVHRIARGKTKPNIHNLNPGPAFAVKAVQPLINSGAVVAREPNVFDPATLPKHAIETVQLPPLGVTMDDCCRISELLLGGPQGGPPSGDTGLTIGIMTILSLGELAVFTASMVRLQQSFWVPP